MPYRVSAMFGLGLDHMMVLVTCTGNIGVWKQSSGMRCEAYVLTLLPVLPFITLRHNVADSWQGKHSCIVLFPIAKKRP